jgi:hypothetical protein
MELCAFYRIDAARSRQHGAAMSWRQTWDDGHAQGGGASCLVSTAGTTKIMRISIHKFARWFDRGGGFCSVCARCSLANSPQDRMSAPVSLCNMGNAMFQVPHCCVCGEGVYFFRVWCHVDIIFTHCRVYMCCMGKSSVIFIKLLLNNKTKKAAWSSFFKKRAL